MLLTEGGVPVLQIFSPASVMQKLLNFHLYSWLGFFEELKCVIVYLNIYDGRTVISTLNLGAH